MPFSGMLKKILLSLITVLLAWAYLATVPPPQRKCGSKDGPPVTAPRIQLKDGRYLAYQEYGVPRDVAEHKIVFIHGFDSCRFDVNAITASLSREIVESRRIYIVSFDRPGYGESDPHPGRTVKSLAYDIEELADQLELGSKFYVLGYSMGGQIAWTCLKYIPHRLAGAALLAPAINFWWSGIPWNVSQEAFGRQLLRDQWATRVARHMPWLVYWWNTQKLFPSSTIINHSPLCLSNQDKELMTKIFPLRIVHQAQVRQQGEFESIYRDAIVGFGAWEFDPTELENPQVRVDVWQGDEDLLVDVKLQRYITEKLKWIQYHEITGAGHMFPYANGSADRVIESLVG